MCLVHREHGDRRPARKIQKCGGGQPFGRDIQQAARTGLGGIQGVGHFRGRHGGIDAGRGYARLGQRADLVLHQGDQRGNDQRQAVQQQGGYLIADRFAGAGRHDAQRVAAGEDGLHQLALPRPERIIAEILL